MATKNQICNLALGRIRAGVVNDVDNETSAQAIQCQVFYDVTVEHLLAMYPWMWARKTIALAPTTGYTQLGWRYEYAYPNQCAQMIALVPQSLVTTSGSSTGPLTPGVSQPSTDLAPIPFEIASTNDVLSDDTVIRTDQDGAYGIYTYAVTNEQRFPALFVQALSWLLAVDLAMNLGGDSTKYYRDRAMTNFVSAMDLAAAQDLNQSEQGRPRMPASIAARYAYGSAPWRNDLPYMWF